MSRRYRQLSGSEAVIEEMFDLIRERKVKGYDELNNLLLHIFDEDIIKTTFPGNAEKEAKILKSVIKVFEDGVVIVNDWSLDEDGIPEALLSAFLKRFHAKPTDSFSYINFPLPCLSLSNQLDFSFITKDEMEMYFNIPIRVAHQANEVGLMLWEAGVFMLEFAISNPGFFSSSHIVEVGAGCGFTSIGLVSVLNTYIIYLYQQINF